MRPQFIRLVLAVGLLFLFSFCRKTNKRLPVVTSSVAITGVNDSRCSGVLYSDGDAAVTEKGICWGLNPDISITNNKIICETKEQTFTAEIKALNPEMAYYFRAYAINEFGISYGKVIRFTTLSVNFPDLILGATSTGVTTATLSVFMNQAKTFAFKTGICWSKNPFPTTLDNTVLISERTYADTAPAVKSYSHALVGLEESTIYYARAFSTNSIGTVYSNEVKLNTVNPINFFPGAIQHTSFDCKVLVSGVDDGQVASVGVCWSTNPLPTVLDNKIEHYYEPEIFFNMGSLTANTTYFVRAYVIIDDKIIYASQIKDLRTLKSTVTDVNGNVYNTVEINGLEWMTSNYRASSYNNGTAIAKIGANNYNLWVNSVNSRASVYCYYNDKSSYDATLGKLYPLYVAQNVNLPPAGWRLATVDEWTAMLASVSGIPDLCIKNGNWQSYNINNSYGFSLYAAGYWDSGFLLMGSETRMWTKAVTGTLTEKNTIYFSSSEDVEVVRYSTGNAQSVRFVKE